MSKIWHPGSLISHNKRIPKFMHWVPDWHISRGNFSFFTLQGIKECFHILKTQMTAGPVFLSRFLYNSYYNFNSKGEPRWQYIPVKSAEWASAPWLAVNAAKNWYTALLPQRMAKPYMFQSVQMDMAWWNHRCAAVRIWLVQHKHYPYIQQNVSCPSFTSWAVTSYANLSRIQLSDYEVRKDLPDQADKYRYIMPPVLFLH